MNLGTHLVLSKGHFVQYFSAGPHCQTVVKQSLCVAFHADEGSPTLCGGVLTGTRAGSWP